MELTQPKSHPLARERTKLHDLRRARHDASHPAFAVVAEHSVVVELSLDFMEDGQKHSPASRGSGHNLSARDRYMGSGVRSGGSSVRRRGGAVTHSIDDLQAMQAAATQHALTPRPPDLAAL